MGASKNPRLKEGQKMFLETCIKMEKMIDAIKDMPTDERNLGLFGLAYEYLLMDMEEEFLRLVDKIGAEFFDKPLAAAMKKDPQVVEFAQIIITKLIEIGYINITLDKK